MIGSTTAVPTTPVPVGRFEGVEVNPERRALLASWGITAVAPEHASDDCDIVIHVSGHESGLTKALEITGDDGTIIEASWYGEDRKSTRLNSSHVAISYAVFCLKKKTSI